MLRSTLLFAISLAACSSTTSSTPTTGPATSSGINGSKLISQLTDAEKTTFCEWSAARQGGYGKVTQCGDNQTVTGPKDLAECLSRLPPSTCTATVAQGEACVNKIGSSDPCTLPVLSAAECAPIRQEGCIRSSADGAQ